MHSFQRIHNNWRYQFTSECPQTLQEAKTYAIETYTTISQRSMAISQKLSMDKRCLVIKVDFQRKYQDYVKVGYLLSRTMYLTSPNHYKSIIIRPINSYSRRDGVEIPVEFLERSHLLQMLARRQPAELPSTGSVWLEGLERVDQRNFKLLAQFSGQTSNTDILSSLSAAETIEFFKFAEYWLIEDFWVDRVLEYISNTMPVKEVIKFLRQSNKYTGRFHEVATDRLRKECLKDVSTASVDQVVEMACALGGLSQE